jgi:hypothetical protein
LDWISILGRFEYKGCVLMWRPDDGVVDIDYQKYKEIYKEVYKEIMED